MQQISYIIKRVLQMIPVLIVVSFITFAGIRLIPGDPATLMLGAEATPENIEAMRISMGLDKPFLIQYFIFLGQLIHLNFGTSLTMNTTVWELFTQKSVITLTLTFATAFFAVLISFPLGYYAGKYENSAFGKAVTALSLAVLSVPDFWLGIILLTQFALKRSYFPVGGWGDHFLEQIHAIILPALTACVATTSLLTRNIQSSVSNILKKDYVNFARSKGLSNHIISSRYVMKNVMVSTMTLLLIRVTNMLSGSIVIETVFALPGLGALLLTAVLKRDYPLVQGLVFLFAVMVLVINLITDVLYSFLDPRVKLQ
ncbi:MAG: ABC transporter permease [Lachnospiraceae bacterium]